MAQNDSSGHLHRKYISSRCKTFVSQIGKVNLKFTSEVRSSDIQLEVTCGRVIVELQGWGVQEIGIRLKDH